MRWFLVGMLIGACGAGCRHDTVPDEALVLDLDRPRPPPDAAPGPLAPAETEQVTAALLAPGERSAVPTLLVRLPGPPDRNVVIVSACETQGYVVEDAAQIPSRWDDGHVTEALLNSGPAPGRCELTFTSSWSGESVRLCVGAEVTPGDCVPPLAAGALAGGESAVVTGARFYLDRAQQPPHLIVQALNLGDPAATFWVDAEAACRRDGFEIVTRSEGSGAPAESDPTTTPTGARFLVHDLGPVADCEVHFAVGDTAVSGRFCYVAARAIQVPCPPPAPPASPPGGAPLVRIDELGERQQSSTWQYTFLATVGAVLPPEARLRAVIECPGELPAIAKSHGLPLHRLRPGQSTPIVVEQGAQRRPETCALRVLLGQGDRPSERWCGTGTEWRRCF